MQIEYTDALAEFMAKWVGVKEITDTFKDEVSNAVDKLNEEAEEQESDCVTYLSEAMSEKKLSRLCEFKAYTAQSEYCPAGFAREVGFSVVLHILGNACERGNVCEFETAVNRLIDHVNKAAKDCLAEVTP
jgi:hypothetical protein